MSLTFSVNICDTNPQRWYVNFNLSKPFPMPYVKKALEKNHYQTLASTPSIMVFRLDTIRLTWHSQGLIQVDYSDQKKRSSSIVEVFIKRLLQIINIEEN